MASILDLNSVACFTKPRKSAMIGPASFDPAACVGRRSGH
jgi:hypothetical protein